MERCFSSSIIPGTSCVDITWKLVRNAQSQAAPQIQIYSASTL